MRRLPIRVRLTAAFATAMLLVLLAAALFVALRLRADLDDQVNNNLQARSVAAINAYREGARLAAVALEHNGELCSTDSDFARFPGLKWRNPLS